jgi:hypothetical protein
MTSLNALTNEYGDRIQAADKNTTSRPLTRLVGPRTFDDAAACERGAGEVDVRDGTVSLASASPGSFDGDAVRGWRMAERCRRGVR